MPFRFKLLHGNHRVVGPRTPDGQRGEGRTIRQGEIFESEFELDKKFGADKFKRLKGSAVSDPDEDDEEDTSDVSSQDDGLDAMTDQELAAYAKEAGIEIKGKKRETIVKLIRESLVNA